MGINGRALPKQIEGSDGRNLQLYFRSKLSLPLFTGGKVEGEQDATIHAVLVDATTGHVMTSGPESSIKLDVVVLGGDFDNEDAEDWSKEEFETHVVKEREGKRPLLNGELQVTLEEGVRTLGELTFTDNSSWIRSRKFRLGLKPASGSCEGIRIQEAKTEAFTVKDHRGELYKKHYPPTLTDEVWRLENIGKDGTFHKRLNAARIFNVEDFLRLAVKDSQKLRKTLRSDMSNRMWEALMEHAKTCVLSGKLYVYFSDYTRNVGVAFNNIYELSGLIAGEQYLAANSLSESQKVYVDTLVKKAYDNWQQVIEYDSNAFVNSKQSQRTHSSQNEIAMNTSSCLNFAVDSQLAITQMPIPVRAEQQVVESSVMSAGFNNNQPGIFPNQAYLMNPDPQHHFEETSSSKQDLSTLVPPQPWDSGFPLVLPSQPSNINPYDYWLQNLFMEEEIRYRSHELLESDDMQQLLRIFGMGGPGSNMPDENFFIPTPPNYFGMGGLGSNMPDENFFIPTPPNYNSWEEDRKRPGKAVVDWLKIKAEMRWGVYIRKNAAERRAQLVELDG